MVNHWNAPGEWQELTDEQFEKLKMAIPSYSNEKWDRRFLELAKHIATWSKDPEKKVGCVITNDDRDPISWGYNGFPRGFEDKPEQYLDVEFKHKFMCHSERNAMDLGRGSLKGCTVYCTYPPCEECQKSLIQKGVKRVVWYKPVVLTEKSKSRTGYELLGQVGIEYKEYETI